MKAFINPGHKVGIDPGACHPYGTTEAQTVLEIGELLCHYLNAAGVETEFLQSNSLNGEDEDYENPSICRTANNSGADIFISLHCNAANGNAQGTETLIYSRSSRNSLHLANCIQTQLIDTLDTVDRGIKERSDLCVLRNTDMPAVLVEIAFIDNDDDHRILCDRKDDIARAIARGVTDYQL
jgi:N-acetylmuramoyl-L-alanine amidase